VAGLTDTYGKRTGLQPGEALPSFASRPTLILLLSVIVTTAFLLRLNEALHTSDLAHPDEIFQTLEPAHRLAYGYGVVTWEWRDGIRSWVLPGVLAGVMKSTDWIGQGSAGYLICIRILLCVVSLSTVWFGFVWAERVDGTAAGVVSAAACATWYEIVSFAPRAMTEVLAAHILLIGLFLGSYLDHGLDRRRLFWAGFCCGIAVSLRIQLAPVVLFAALYFSRGHIQKRCPILISGVLLPVLCFGLVDGWTWHHPFQSLYLYFWENTVEGRSLLYGTKPWYWYLAEQMEHLGPLGLLAIIGVRRSTFLGWIVFIILASHSMLGHKEARFLYPALPILIVLSALGFGEIAKEFSSILKISISPTVFVSIGITFFLFFSWILGPRFTYWAKNSGGMIAFSHLSESRGICGVGLYGVPWFTTGGYSYLHQSVPIILVPGFEQLDKGASTFNAVVAREDWPIPRSEFVRSQCWNGVCLYQRTGSCTHPDKYEINRVLRETGN